MIQTLFNVLFAFLLIGNLLLWYRQIKMNQHAQNLFILLGKHAGLLKGEMDHGIETGEVSREDR